MNTRQFMQKGGIKRFAVLCMAVSLTMSPLSASAALLKKGSQNNEVKMVQTTLKQLGYFEYSKATGYYGNMTVKAVKKFQKRNGLVADGVVGYRTRTLLKNYRKTTNTTTNKTTNKTTNNTTTYKTEDLTSEKKYGALDWFDRVQYIWTKGTNATVIDVDTGKTFQMKRTFGYNHADVEPLTSKDAKVVKDIWNGWSWERRAVVVQIGDYVLAASMTAMPHAGMESQPSEKVVNNRSCGYGRGYNLDAVKNNSVSGVMDIHFAHSRTHSSNTEQKSQQDMVKKAAQYIKEQGL